jgi:hypothetical protein
MSRNIRYIHQVRGKDVAVDRMRKKWMRERKIGEKCLGGEKLPDFGW